MVAFYDFLVSSILIDTQILPLKPVTFHVLNTTYTQTSLSFCCIEFHVSQEQKRQEAYEEFLKEKLMIDEIVRKIYEEDER